VDIRRSILGVLTGAWAALAGFGALAVDGVLVFGGTRETGLETVRTLVAKGDSVTVMVRATSNTEALKAVGKVNLVVGDAMNAEDVRQAFASGKFRAVVSSLGGTRGQPRPDWEGNRNVTDAAKAAGVKRLVQVSAIGTGDSVVAVSAETIKFLGPVYAEKIKAEDHLKASGLVYTIIRPGGLTDEPATGNGMLTEDVTVGGEMTRADLGKLVAESIDDPKAANKVYSAVDRNRIAKAPMVPSR
jgi:uncharacterized protein YbjT (DUF2867 family)